MRNLKRALSLTLASVMLLGMMVVGSSAAKGYDDVAETDNVEAIEVVQAVGVMVGDENGNFRPGDSVSRAEMAVVIGKLLTLNYDYFSATCPFTDVSGVYDWARGWVGACAANGYVSGRGEGIYDPGATVTAVEAASMLMRTLGYFKYSNDFADGFEVSTVRQGTTIGIFDGVGSSATEPMTRNQVAQMVLNALQCGMVEPDGNTINLTTPDGTVLTGKVNYVKVTSNKAFAKAISAIQATAVGSNNDSPIVELGEQLYNGDLRLDSYDNDVFGRPARTWEYKGEQIGTYVKKELLKQSYTTEVTGKELYELLSKKTVDEYQFEIYIDGIDVDEGKAVLDGGYGYFTEGNLVRTNTRGVGATGKGVLTEVYVDNNPEVYNTNSNIPGIVYIAVMNTYLAKASEDYNEKKDEVTFTIWDLAERDNGRCLVKDVKDAFPNASRAASGEYFDVKDIKKNDIYLVRVADNAIQKMYDPEIIADTTLSSFSVGNWVNNGTKYDYANTAEYDDKVLDEYDYPNMKEVTYDIYLDMFGYMIGIEQNSDPDQYVFLAGIDAGASNLTTKTADANIIHMDGTMETVTVDMTKSLAACYKDANHEKHGLLYHDGRRDDDANPGTGTRRNLSQLNTWCTYTVSTNGVYTLKEVPYGTGAGTLGQFAQGAAQQPDKASAPNTKTINEKRTSLIASTGATGAVTSWVYGNDDTVYINVDMKGVRVQDTYDHIDGDGVNGNYRRIIDDVNTVVTGIKDVDIEVNTLPVSKPNEIGGSEYYNPDKEIFTLYKEGIVLGAVTIGEDNGSAATWAYIISDKPRQEDYAHASGNAAKAAKPGEWTWYREAIVNGKIVDLVEVGDSLEWIGTPAKGQGIMVEGEWYEVKMGADGQVRKAQTLEEALNPDIVDGKRVEKRYLTESKTVETQINTENGDVALHMLFTRDMWDAIGRKDTLTFKNGNLYTNSDLTKGFSVSRDVLVVLAQAELKSGVSTDYHGYDDPAYIDQFKVVNDTYEGYDGLKAALDRMKSGSVNFVGDLNVIFHNGAASVIIINDIWGDYINEGGDKVSDGTVAGKLTIENKDNINYISDILSGSNIEKGDVFEITLSSSAYKVEAVGASVLDRGGNLYRVQATADSVLVRIVPKAAVAQYGEVKLATGLKESEVGKISAGSRVVTAANGAVTAAFTLEKPDWAFGGTSAYAGGVRAWVNYDIVDATTGLKVKENGKAITAGDGVDLTPDAKGEKFAGSVVLTTNSLLNPDRPYEGDMIGGKYDVVITGVNWTAARVEYKLGSENAPTTWPTTKYLETGVTDAGYSLKFEAKGVAGYTETKPATCTIAGAKLAKNAAGGASLENISIQYNDGTMNTINNLIAEGGKVVTVTVNNIEKTPVTKWALSDSGLTLKGNTTAVHITGTADVKVQDILTTTSDESTIAVELSKVVGSTQEIGTNDTGTYANSSKTAGKYEVTFDETSKKTDLLSLKVVFGADGSTKADAYKVSITIRDEDGKAVSTFSKRFDSSATNMTWDATNADVDMTRFVMDGNLVIKAEDVKIERITKAVVLDKNSTEAVKSSYDEDSNVLTLVFDQDMDMSTINTNTVTAKGATTNDKCTIVKVETEGKRTVKVTLADFLAADSSANRTATVVLSSGIKAENGLGTGTGEVSVIVVSKTTSPTATDAVGIITATARS